MGMKSKTNPVAMSSTSKKLELTTVDEFPQAICLEHCQTTMVRGYEKHVNETLKSFSDKTQFNTKKPHPLHKEGGGMDHFFRTAKQVCGTEKVYSLDVKARHDSKRMFYCKDKRTGTIKILALCSEESH